MEILAFTHGAIAYEDPTPSPELAIPCLDEMLPSSGWLGLASLITVLGAFTAVPNAAFAQLQPGDTGVGVEALQSSLRGANYYDGAVTGFYGALTQTAVTAFQRDRGLVADGVAGADTLSALGLSASLAATNLTATGFNPTGSVVSRSSAGVGGAVLVSNGRYDTGVVETPSKIGVNVRNTPYGTVVGGEPDGATVAYSPASSTYTGGYTWVQRPDGNWVAGDYLRGLYTGADPSLPGTLPIGTGGTFRVTASELNVRVAPSGAVIDNLPGGSVVSLTGEEAATGGYRWGKLAVRSGWVAKEFLTPVTDGGAVTLPGTIEVGFAPGTARIEQQIVIVRDRPNGLNTGTVLYQGEIIRTTGSITSAGGGDWVELVAGGWVPREALTLISR